MYDIFKHGVGVMVREIKTGRFGVVVSIEETMADWIEPVVDFGSGPERPRYALELSDEQIKIETE